MPQPVSHAVLDVSHKQKKKSVFLNVFKNFVYNVVNQIYGH